MLAGCEVTEPIGQATVTVTLSVSGAGDPIPISVRSLNLEARTAGCLGPVAFSETRNLTAGQAGVTFSLALPSDANACFTARAYSAADAQGTLIYEGSTPGVDLSGGGSVDVQVDMDLVGTTPPAVSTSPAVDVTSTTATFVGIVNPEGFPTVGYFDWGLTTEYGSRTPMQPLGAGIADMPLSQAINGLTAGTTYHYRAVATSGEHIVTGLDQSFLTPGTNTDVDINFPALAPPTVTTEPASGITGTAAQLHATVNPQGTATTMYFDWGVDTD
jgi:hypothetical protein